MLIGEKNKTDKLTPITDYLVKSVKLNDNNADPANSLSQNQSAVTVFTNPFLTPEEVP